MNVMNEMKAITAIVTLVALLIGLLRQGLKLWREWQKRGLQQRLIPIHIVKNCPNCGTGVALQRPAPEEFHWRLICPVCGRIVRVDCQKLS